MRLDQAISLRYPAISRRKARQLLADGRVLVNQRPVSIASREVRDIDDVRVIEALPEIPVIVSTDDWLAVDKPAGMPTQPARDRAQTSLEEILRAQHKKIWLVHRIDTPSSGVVVFARSAAAAARLSALFAARAIRKLYLARVNPPVNEALTIDTPIEGKDALTLVTPRERDLVEVEIRTGRLHQIRRHLSAAGHPIVGDRRYSDDKNSPRLMLHSWRLEHTDLGLIEAPVPPEFL